ncbi:32079_t:CDS:1, partial [Racocetra persica]
MSVYQLHGDQYRYRDNIIKFPQDIQEFTTHLSRHPLSLNMFIVHHKLQIILNHLETFMFDIL